MCMYTSRPAHSRVYRQLKSNARLLKYAESRLRINFQILHTFSYFFYMKFKCNNGHHNTIIDLSKALKYDKQSRVFRIREDFKIHIHSLEALNPILSQIKIYVFVH